MFLPKRLVFSGGGTRCLVFLPALKRLESQQRLRAVHEWWGTSAGALLAAIMGITKSAVRTQDILHQTVYDKFRDISLLNMVNFTDTWGLDDGYSMVAEIERILELAKPGGSQMTMSDVSGVRIVVADLNAYETVVCSDATFPTLRIADAIRASMSLPVLYRPFRCPINGHIWVDGGLRAAFPWECLPSKAAREESLGFAFEKSWIAGPRTFTEYMFSMLHFEDPKMIATYKRQWKQHILWFPSPPFPAWYVRIQEDDKRLLETLGTETIERWFTSHTCSETPQKKPSSEDHCTPAPACPEHCTDGMSETRLPCPSPSQVPSRDLPEHRPPSRRRWSL
jgi:NTE family protein